MSITDFTSVDIFSHPCYGKEKLNYYSNSSECDVLTLQNSY
ncbi:MAG: hypothetical protein WD061_01825 [Candidatus Saccharimonadales bacterium]